MRGDEYYMAVCNKTGTIAVYNPARNLFLSPLSDGPLQFSRSLEGDQVLDAISRFGRSFSLLRIPYALKLLMQELQTMGVQMRVITDENIDQLQNMSFRSGNVERLLGLDPQAAGAGAVGADADATHKKNIKALLNEYRVETLRKLEDANRALAVEAAGTSALVTGATRTTTRPEWAASPPETLGVLPPVTSAAPQSPQFVPSGSPAYAPGSPMYAPGSPMYAPGSPAYAPGSPAYAPGSPAYAPGSPQFVPSGSPEYAPGTPPPPASQIGGAAAASAFLSLPSSTEPGPFLDAQFNDYFFQLPADRQATLRKMPPQKRVHVMNEIVRNADIKMRMVPQQTVTEELYAQMPLLAPASNSTTLDGDGGENGDGNGGSSSGGGGSSSSGSGGGMKKISL